MPEPDVQTFVNNARYPFRRVRNRWYFQERETWLWDFRTRRLCGELIRIFSINEAQARHFIPFLAQTLTCEDPKLITTILRQAEHL